MRFTITGDLHAFPFGEFSRSVNEVGSTQLSESILSTVRWIKGVVEDDSLIINGDLTTTPGLLDAPTIRLLSRIEYELDGVDRIYNLGNHDCSSKHLGLHNLELHQMGGASVVEPRTVFNAPNSNLYIVPYTFTTYEQRELIYQIPDKSVVCVHYPIKGIHMTPEVAETDGLDVSEFLRFEITYASHYHIPQIWYAKSKGGYYKESTVIKSASSYDVPFGSIIVTGTPLAHSFSDTNPTYGIWKHKEEGKVDFVENPFCPIYVNSRVTSLAEVKKTIPKTTRPIYLSLQMPKDLVSEVKNSNVLGSVTGSRLREIIDKPKAVTRQEVSSPARILDSVKEFVQKKEINIDLEKIDLILTPLIDSAPKLDGLGGEVRFDSLHLSNFLSWDTAQLELSSPDLTLVTGINHDSSTADSNGSGKSSLVEALVWCLFDRTFRGVSKDEIIRTGIKGGCSVTVSFYTDDGFFRVTRFRRNPTSGIRLEKWGSDWTDISSSTTAATDKQIIQLLGFDFDTFAILSFLGQGFQTKFSDLNDAGRKRLLESIFGLSTYDYIKDEVDKLYKSSKQTREKLDSEIVVREQTVERLSERLAILILQAEEDAVKNKGKISLINTQIEDLSKKTDHLQDEYTALKEEQDCYVAKTKEEFTKRNELLTVFTTVESEQKSIEREILAQRKRVGQAETLLERSKRAVESVSTDCPTCGQPLASETLKTARRSKMLDMSRAVQSLREERVALSLAEDMLKIKQAEMEDVQALLSDCNVQDYETTLFKLKDKKYSVQSDLIRLQEQRTILVREMAALVSYDPYALIRPLEASIKDEATYLTASVAKLDTAKVDENFYSELVSIFNPKALRSFILDESVSILNDHLRSVCSLIFDDGNTLEIHSSRALKSGKEDNTLSLSFAIAGGSYASASGGERRKADLAIHLALSSLAKSLGRGSTNLLIADEVLDTLDQTASRAVVEALHSIAEAGKRVLLISHSPHASSFVNSILRVEKHDGVSKLVI